MPVLLVNNAVSRLGASLSADALALSVSAGDGGKFPSPGPGDWFPLTLIRADGVREIVRCTKRIGDVLTVTRAQEGTVGVPLASGDKVELRLTVGALNTLFGGAQALPTFGSMELTATTPYIDFHAANSADDFTSRIIAEANAVLVIRSAAKEQARFTDNGLSIGDIRVAGVGYFEGGIVRVGYAGATPFTDFGPNGNIATCNAAGALLNGGVLWHTGNFDPASRVAADGITYAGFASGNLDLPYFLRPDGGVHYLQRRLGFVPVQQGTGGSQLGNTVKIGFDGGHPRISVDATDFGRFYTELNPQPIMGTVAAQGTGGVGTYAFLRNNSGVTVGAGTLLAGSSLAYADHAAGSSGNPGGTWRCMGWGFRNNATVWMRIS